MRVKPKAGCLVRDPASNLPLPAEGAEVSETPYWLRRIRAGDVELVVPSQPKNTKKEHV